MACKIVGLEVSARGGGRLKSDSSVVMYTKEGRFSKQISEFGRVSCFFEHPNEGGQLYAVIRRLERGDELLQALDVPRNAAILRHYDKGRYGTNAYIVQDKESYVVDIVACSAIMKHAVIMNVPAVGQIVKAMPLAYTHS